MTTATLVLVLVVVAALAFDFTNGFHDTGNAMATSIATGALRPKIAVGLSAVLNLVGAFLSVEVALTVTNAVINIQDSKGAPKAELMADGGYALLLIILAGLVGGIVWNLLTWLLGLPSSSSHALFGGLIGAAVAALGLSGVKWTGDGTKLDGVIGKVILPAFASPVIAGVVAALGTWLIFRVVGGRRGAVHRPGLPVGPDRQRVARLAGPRHQRRPEDDGRHHPRPHRGRPVDRHHGRPDLGQGLPARWPSLPAPTSAAGGSSARSARGWSRSPRRRAWPPRARPPR